MNAIPAGVWCVFSDAAPAQLPALGVAALRAGASAMTLRRPIRGDGAAVQAWRAPELAGAWRAVHARADLAAASGSQAVIAGVRSLPVAALRRAFPRLLVGASVHDEVEAAAAVSDGAHFLLFGPIWSTPEKHGVLLPRGIPALSRVCAVGVPVIAIGGILKSEQLLAARAAGAHACAVLRAASDPAALAKLVSA
ncbi:MAG: thiamine phosphate synthase [Planctomycetota bacterium]|nr:thiamine phosphate synthase [Planctomycetota bacterium]